MKTITYEQSIKKQDSDPLPNIASLRPAKLFGNMARYFECDNESDILINFPQNLSHHDKEDYPDASTITICRTGDCFGELAGLLPEGKHTIKISGQLRDSRLRETNQFISMTTRSAPAIPPIDNLHIMEMASPEREMLDLFKLSHWEEDDILAMTRNGAKLYCVTCNKDIVAACMVHNAYGKIWEIGALGTDPEFQGHGYAKKLVKSVTAEILAEGKIPRYHVNSENRKSIAVAESCGYKPFMIFCHYEFEIRSTGIR